jgi:hypothetical protein
MSLHYKIQGKIIMAILKNANVKKKTAFGFDP